MDLPPPILQQSHQMVTDTLATESRQLAEATLIESTQRLIDITMEKYPDNINIQDDGTIIANVAVSIDST